MFENKQTHFREKQNHDLQFQNWVFALMKNFTRLVNLALIAEKIRKNSNSQLWNWLLDPQKRKPPPKDF